MPANDFFRSIPPQSLNLTQTSAQQTSAEAPKDCFAAPVVVAARQKAQASALQTHFAPATTQIHATNIDDASNPGICTNYAPIGRQNNDKQAAFDAPANCGWEPKLPATRPA